MVFFVGCAEKAALRRPAPPPSQPREKNETLRHLEGTWENDTGGGTPRQMIFEPSGHLTFQGGLEFYNPAEWAWDPSSQDLTLTFPETADAKLQIFQMYVGEEVKALDRRRKQVTYHFDDETWTLNVAGWQYSKPENHAIDHPPEPILK